MNQKVTSKFLYLLLVFAILEVSIQSKLLYAYSLIRHGAEYPKNDLYDGA